MEKPFPMHTHKKKLQITRYVQIQMFESFGFVYIFMKVSHKNADFNFLCCFCTP